MSTKKIEDELKMISELNRDTEYLRGEFKGKLCGSVPDGDVKLESIIAFAQENEGLLEHVADFAKKLNRR